MLNRNSTLNETYEIRKEIGSGGSGVVYFAVHRRLQKSVVIKKTQVVAGNLSENRREADVLKSLKHTFLPQVLDFIVDGTDVYTVMDYIEGETFRQIVDRGRVFTQKEAARYGEQLLEALVYLHTRRIPVLHGDIKPSNVMLTPDNNICLIDFNISGFINGDRLAAVGFTKGYAAPEQIAAVNLYRQSGANVTGTGAVNPTGKANNTVIIDERADIYSTGAFLYRLVTGKVPDVDPGKRIPLRSFQGFSNGFAAVIDKAMSYQPHDRYSSAQQMLKALRGYAKTDKRYRRLVFRQRFFFFVRIIAIAGCLLMAFHGYRLRQSDQADQYEGYILDMQNAAEEKDEEGFLAAYESALKLDAENRSAYVEYAGNLYKNRMYDDAIQYIDDIALDDPDAFSSQKSSVASLYYIRGNCYYEKGDLQKAANSFSTAIHYDDSAPQYYRDLAITKAQTGDIGAAEDALNDAERTGMMNDQLMLVKGEIEYVRGNRTEAISQFSGCIDSTDDDYVKMRAYMLLSEVYETDPPEIEMIEEKARLLDEARRSLPSDLQPLILEKLGEAYTDLYEEREDDRDASSAIRTYELIVKGGWANINTYNNLIVLAQKSGRLSEAANYARDMINTYESRYEPYKRMAFVEIASQEEHPEENRDYRQFEDYYLHAHELYTDTAGTNETDGEMLILENAYQRLREEGWL